MPLRTSPDILTVLVVLAISLISGFIALARQIVQGHGVTWVWVTSEVLAAVLCGYLMWDLYPHIRDALPDWITMPVLVAFAAHLGSRSFQEFENYLARKYPRLKRHIEKPD